MEEGRGGEVEESYLILEHPLHSMEFRLIHPHGHVEANRKATNGHRNAPEVQQLCIGDILSNISK